MAATAAQQQTPPSSTLARWTPTFSTGLINLINPFASDNTNTTVNSASASKDAPSSTVQRRSIFAGILYNDESTTVDPPSPSSGSAKSIMFAEPDTRSTSDVDSREGSISVANKSNTKLTRPKTRYSICHPPPASLTRVKLHRRPRSLLQFHKLSSKSRPTPAFDVIPSANFDVKLTRTVAKIFKARHGLCPNDLLVLHAESYSQEEDEDQEARDIIGLICKGRKEDDAPGKARICVANGKEWEAYPLANGGYEFFTVDEHGLALTVRWVMKKSRDRAGNAKGQDQPGKRFNFSTISPNTRRHPVIANLCFTGLDINDLYKMPTPIAAETPNVTPRQTSILAETMENESIDGVETDVDTRETDAELRQLIILTSIWVTFKEGWSPTFRYDDKEKNRDASYAGSPQLSPAKALDSPLPSAGFSSLDRPLSMRNISASLLRKSSLRRANRASIVSSVPSVDEEDESQIMGEESASPHGRRRADSNSTVLMHPVPADRRKSSRQATWRPDLLASKSQIKEASRENSMDVRPTQLQRASWQSQSVDHVATVTRANSKAQEVEPPVTKVDHSDIDAKAYSTAADTSSEDGHDTVRIRRPQKDSIASSQPVHSAVERVSQQKKKSSGGGWRRLWCGSSDK